jgi:hypothetical protein
MLTVASVAFAQETRLEALVAMVGPRVIMLSDVRLARGLGLVAADASTDATVKYLVDRALMLTEVERFQEPDPVEAGVDQALAALRARVGADRWQQVLASTGVDDAYVRALVRDNLRVEAYLQQRFEALSEPGEEDLRAAYEQRRAASPGAALAPFETLRPALHDELHASRFRDLQEQWVAELRTRGDVSIRAGAGDAAPAPDRP